MDRRIMGSPLNKTCLVVLATRDPSEEQHLPYLYADYEVPIYNTTPDLPCSTYIFTTLCTSSKVQQSPFVTTDQWMTCVQYCQICYAVASKDYGRHIME